MVQETAAQGLHTPVVFRFLDILGHRMGMLNVRAHPPGWG